MREFEDDLAAMFLEPSGDAGHEAVTSAVLARVAAQSRRHGLVMAGAGMAGGAIALAAVASSGAAGAIGRLLASAKAPSLMAPYHDLGALPLWTVLGVGLALTVFAGMRATARES